MIKIDYDFWKLEIIGSFPMKIKRERAAEIRDFLYLKCKVTLDMVRGCYILDFYKPGNETLFLLLFGNDFRGYYYLG